VPAEAPLAVRTRLPGDRVHAKGREMSLKRFLIDRRVPADLRARLPLVAAGRQVLWVAGQALDAPVADANRPCVRLELVGAA
jgi:tRNA(Ile)-lysidine synthetase-like protein